MKAQTDLGQERLKKPYWQNKNDQMPFVLMVLVLVVPHMETESHQNCSQVMKIKVPHIYSVCMMKIAVASKQARDMAFLWKLQLQISSGNGK